MAAPEFDPNESLRAMSPRPETPEPDSRQGRRNASEAGVQLLDDEGAISDGVRIFACLSFLCHTIYPPASYLRSPLLLLQRVYCACFDGTDIHSLSRGLRCSF